MFYCGVLVITLSLELLCTPLKAPPFMQNKNIQGYYGTSGVRPLRVRQKKMNVKC